jgi:hypothetical protein
VPFVRVVRDKRGYEHVYLVHTSARRGKPARARTLYWYRTPPGVRVGREPFDEQVRQALESQYPDIRFEWDKLRVLPPAPQDVEIWRERRRAVRAAKLARAADVVGEGEQPLESAEDALVGAGEPSGAPESLEENLNVAMTLETSPGEGEAATLDRTLSQNSSPTASAAPAGRRRRRRRGGRGRRDSASPAGNTPPASEANRTAPMEPTGITPRSSDDASNSSEDT